MNSVCNNNKQNKCGIVWLRCPIYELLGWHGAPKQTKFYVWYEFIEPAQRQQNGSTNSGNNYHDVGDDNHDDDDNDDEPAKLCRAY